MSKKRRGSPLQEWRSQYGYVSGQLRDIKRGIRSGEGWSRFSSSQGQFFILALKVQAQELMEARAAAAAKAQAFWDKGTIHPANHAGEHAMEAAH